MDELLNSTWWVQALIEHRKLDVEEHSGERAHQKRDPDAIDLHHDEHELTPWERAWITQRINDAHVQHLMQRSESRAVLEEPEHEHLARELDARAHAYFGASHAAVRAKMAADRAEHVALHARVPLLEHRSDPNAPLQKLSRMSVDELQAMVTQTIAQIDEYLEPGNGLIDRHRATVMAEVKQARAEAQKKIDDCERLLSMSYEEHLARELARVEAEIRAVSAPKPAVG